MNENIIIQLVKDFNREVRELNRKENIVIKCLKQKKRKSLHESRRDYIYTYKNVERTLNSLVSHYNNLYIQISILNNKVETSNDKEYKRKIKKVIRKLDSDGRRIDKVVQKKLEEMNDYKIKKEKLINMKI